MKTWRSYHALRTCTTLTATPGRPRDSGGHGSKTHFGTAFGTPCPNYPVLRRWVATQTNQTSAQHFGGYRHTLAKTL
jgi:hypothetical protein